MDTNGGFMKKTHKIATYLLVGSLIFTGNTAIVSADNKTAASTELNTSEESTVDDGLQVTGEPVAGIDLSLDEVYQKTENADKKITQCITTSDYANLAFAHVTNYVNIRSKANENSKILGKLYNNSAADIMSKKNGWYKIKSGSVTGYIKAEFLITGDKALQMADSVGNRVAEVATVTLKVREKPSTDSTVVTLVAQEDDLKVMKEQDGWTKVRINEKESGFVSNDYVNLQTIYEEAVSIEEEQQRLEEEAAADRQASEASNSDSSSDSNKASGHSSSGSSASNNTEVTYRPGSSSLADRIVSYALQFQGNPYVWGGTSLTKGADCSGFTQSVFAHFGISIPRTSRTQATSGSRVSISELHSGDLIFYTRNGTINHVALYIGNGKVISASSPSTGIRITSYNYRQPYKAVSYIN